MQINQRLRLRKIINKEENRGWYGRLWPLPKISGKINLLSVHILSSIGRVARYSGNDPILESRWGQRAYLSKKNIYISPLTKYCTFCTCGKPIHSLTTWISHEGNLKNLMHLKSIPGKGTISKDKKYRIRSLEWR